MRTVERLLSRNAGTDQVTDTECHDGGRSVTARWRLFVWWSRKKSLVRRFFSAAFWSGVSVSTG
jgi:hypothetical protein